jgi:hypothetical protein
VRACWAGTTETDHAQRCVPAHYLADLEGDLGAEVDGDEQALAAFAHVRDTDLAPIGISAAPAMAPSLHLNLGDGYVRQGRTALAQEQVTAGIAALDALPDDGYGAMIRGGLTRSKNASEARPEADPFRSEFGRPPRPTPVSRSSLGPGAGAEAPRQGGDHHPSQPGCT